MQVLESLVGKNTPGIVDILLARFQLRHFSIKKTVSTRFLPFTALFVRQGGRHIELVREKVRNPTYADFLQCERDGRLNFVLAKHIFKKMVERLLVEALVCHDGGMRVGDLGYVFGFVFGCSLDLGS